MVDIREEYFSRSERSNTALSPSRPTIPATPWQALSSFISPIDGRYLSNDNNKVAAHCERCPPLYLHQWLRSLKVLDPWQVALILLQLSHDFHSDLAGVVHFTEVTILVLDLVSYYCRYIFPALPLFCTRSHMPGMLTGVQGSR